MTIEDPVEYQIPGVNQIEVNSESGLTFARGLRTILRSDPDVLLVGEIRDEETARIADPGGDDRPPRAQHAARAQRGELDRAAQGHGRRARACSRPRSTASSRSGSHAGSASSAGEPYRPDAEERGARATMPATGQLYRAGRLRSLRRHRLPRPRRALRGDAVPGQAARARRAARPSRSSPPPSSRAWRRCARTASRLALAGMTSSTRSAASPATSLT